jgi:hypothetical protein
MSAKKAGSYRGGRKPIEKRDRILDRDRDRKALQRATKAGFATVEEHRKSIAAKEAARCANRFHIVDSPSGRTIVRQSNEAPAAPVVQVQAAQVADDWPVEPAPAPVSTERQPRRWNIATKRWEVATAKEAEEIAGRRELCRGAYRENCNPLGQIPVIDWAQSARDAKRRDEIAADNLKRYF